MSSNPLGPGECPDMSDLASYVEGGKLDPSLHGHVEACDACAEAIRALEEEVASLQIPLSEIWFREHISCPHIETLEAFEAGNIADPEKDYVRFHLLDLGCPHCQGRLEARALRGSEEGRDRVRASRRKTGEATSVLLDELRSED